jgi:hypothetical protein
MVGWVPRVKQVVNVVVHVVVMRHEYIVTRRSAMESRPLRSTRRDSDATNKEQLDPTVDVEHGWWMQIRVEDRRRLTAHKQWFREGSGPLASLEKERAETQRALRRRATVNRTMEDANDEAGGSASSMRCSKRA